QKMSKSLGNAIGIQEAPLQMYGKLMSISDEMMWRYWELLTDMQMGEIEKTKTDVAAGQAHPMTVKKELARRIVQDFHSADAAKQAEEDWAKQFQKDEVPENVESVQVSHADVASGDHAVNLAKLLAKCGLAESVSDGSRKLKQKSVKIDGEVKIEPVLPVKTPCELLLRVGRSMKKVTIN